MIDYREINAFAVKNNDTKILKKSSSGGIFFILAKHFIEIGGYVCACTYNSEGNVYHSITNSYKDLDKMIGSKYVQSKIGNCFVKIKELLLKGERVLFCGTPCQVSALDLYLNGVNKENLLKIDFICHGTPAEKYWKKYLESINCEKVNYLNFRCKKPSWENYSLIINNKKIQQIKNPYMYYFLNNYTLTKPCYDCKYKGFNRCSDITLCDFWGHNNKFAIKSSFGISGVIFNNLKSIEYLKLIKKYAIVKPCNLLDIVQLNHSYFNISTKPNDYEQVTTRLLNDGFHNLKIKKNNIFFLIKQWLKKIIKGVIYAPIVWNEKIKNKKNVNLYNQIGIISIVDYSNFGNKLQNFALITLFRKQGYEAYNINNKTSSYKIRSHLLNYINLSVVPLNKNEKKRISEIKKCSKKYENNIINFSYSTRDKEKINNLGLIIFGSDQIWNFSYKYNLKFALGDFGIANENFQKVSYAASIGNKIIDEKFLNLYYKNLSKFKMISCRESSSTSAIKQMGLNSDTVLDPTLLLSRDEWQDFISKYSKLHLANKKYILLYFLKNNKEKSKIKDIFLNQNNIEIIDILDMNSKYFVCNQFDFLNLIKNAEQIFTDSFHACVFSILFEKKFSVFSRNHNSDFDPMYTRIINLFNIFDLHPKRENGNTFCKEDFCNKETFNRLKAKSISFLNASLDLLKTKNV